MMLIADARIKPTLMFMKTSLDKNIVGLFQGCGLGLEAISRRCDVSRRLKFEITPFRLGLETECLSLGLGFGPERLDLASSSV